MGPHRSPSGGRRGGDLARRRRATKDRTADLVGELYELLAVLDLRSWDPTDPLAVNRLGTLARFSALLAD